MQHNDIKYGFVSDFEDPFNVYLLGLWWADGHVNKDLVAHSCLHEDAEWMIPIISEWGVKTTYKATPKGGKLQWVMRINSTNLSRFLMKYDYHVKSGISPDKILSEIPEELHYLWWRGYFDGDGSLKPTPGFALTFCSTYKQDWTFFHNIMRKLEIPQYHLRRQSYTGGTCSVASLHATRHVIKFCDYMYQGVEMDGLGLSRKKDKYDILKKYDKENARHKMSKYKYVTWNTNAQKWLAKIDTARFSKMLGSFDDQESAARCIDDFILSHPEFVQKLKHVFSSDSVETPPFVKGIGVPESDTLDNEAIDSSIGFNDRSGG